MKIREMTVEDIRGIALLAAENSGTPWSENALLTYLLRDDTILMVSEDDDGRLTGFCGVLLMPPESEILDIAVDAGVRHLGIGTVLMSSVLREARKRGTSVTYLEVRESNVPAIGLYEKTGFEPYGRRARYYTDPVEDAIVMRLSLC